MARFNAVFEDIFGDSLVITVTKSSSVVNIEITENRATEGDVVAEAEFKAWDAEEIAATLVRAAAVARVNERDNRAI